MSPGRRPLSSGGGEPAARGLRGEGIDQRRRARRGRGSQRIQRGGYGGYDRSGAGVGQLGVQPGEGRGHRLLEREQEERSGRAAAAAHAVAYREAAAAQARGQGKGERVLARDEDVVATHRVGRLVVAGGGAARRGGSPLPRQRGPRWPPGERRG